jgi:hypothetical protein
MRFAALQAHEQLDTVSEIKMESERSNSRLAEVQSFTVPNHLSTSRSVPSDQACLLLQLAHEHATLRRFSPEQAACPLWLLDRLALYTLERSRELQWTCVVSICIPG